MKDGECVRRGAARPMHRCATDIELPNKQGMVDKMAALGPAHDLALRGSPRGFAERPTRVDLFTSFSRRCRVNEVASICQHGPRRLVVRVARSSLGQTANARPARRTCPSASWGVHYPAAKSA
jgi:hypothetical protein